MKQCNVFLKLVLKSKDGDLSCWDFNPALNSDCLEKLINDVIDNIPHVDWYVLEPLNK